MIQTALRREEIEQRMRTLVQSSFRAKPRFIGSERDGTWTFRQNLTRRGGFRPRITARVGDGVLYVGIRPPVVESVVMALVVIGLSWVAFQTVIWGVLFAFVMFGILWISFAHEARGIAASLRKEL